MGVKRSLAEADDSPKASQGRSAKSAKGSAHTNSGLKDAYKSHTESTQDDIVLVDSSENEAETEEIVVQSESDVDGQSLEENGAISAETGLEPPRKRQKTTDIGNEVAGNNDFIGFGFSSSDEDGGSDSDSENGVENHPKSAESNHHKNVQGDSSSAFPWVRGQNHSTQKEIADWLTLEIKDFVNYISPSKDEIVVRNTVISSLKRHISHFWPQTQAHVFGSCATDLYLPGSDIDMVVISSTGDYEQRSRLYQLSSYLRTHKLAKNIEVIASAKVPIIKFVDPEHNIHVDVSFERTNGIDAARRIRRWLDTNPGLRELVLIVKQFLRSRMLNNVHVGGLGGYATIIMVYHFMRMHPRIATGNLVPMENLGTLLIEFFELYGRNFSYDNLIISLDPRDDSPRYLSKYRYPTLNLGRGQFTIIIQDPSDPDNNITRSSYNLRDLKKAFGGAYQLLTAKCYELNSASYKNRIGRLILGDIITYKGKDRDFNDDRDKVVNSALISHETSGEESDGAEGNDKYYLSDMTGESENETYVLTKPTKNAETDNTLTKPAKNVEDYVSLEVESEDDEEEAGSKSQKSKANLEKVIKRDYWNLKGLEAA